MTESRVHLTHSPPFNQNKSQNTPSMQVLLRRLKVFYIRSDKDLFDNISFLAIKYDKTDLLVNILDQGNPASH